MKRTTTDNGGRVCAPEISSESTKRAVSPIDWLDNKILELNKFQQVYAEIEENDCRIPIKPGFVYAMHAKGTQYFKFGFSKDPVCRLKQVSPKMPFETELAYIWPTNFMQYAESLLHKEFSDLRANGEWFNLSPNDAYCLFAEGIARRSADIGQDILDAYCCHFLESVLGLSPAEWLESLLNETGFVSTHAVYGAIHFIYANHYRRKEAFFKTDSLVDLVLQVAPNSVIGGYDNLARRFGRAS